jgi:hypothetical protein
MYESLFKLTFTQFIYIEFGVAEMRIFPTNPGLGYFIISYNMLIYLLQKYCGFKVKTFMTSNL